MVKVAILLLLRRRRDVDVVPILFLLLPPASNLIQRRRRRGGRQVRHGSGAQTRNLSFNSPAAAFFLGLYRILSPLICFSAT